MSEKWQVGVYLIHKNNKITRNIYEILENNKKTYEQKQRYLLKELKVNNDEKYKPQKLKISEKDGFELYLFYRKHSKTIPPWKNFLSNIVEDEEDIRKTIRNKNESFILFLFHKEDKNLYVICGGYGIFTIQNFVDDDFGIKILMRIAKDKNEKILKSSKEFGVTGSIAGISKYFRTEYNFYENDNFGNIYKELSAYIDKDTAKLLGLDNEDTKQCIAKNSFKLNQSITFDEMIKVVSNLNGLLKKESNFSINEIKLINTKKDEEVIQNLQNQVVNALYVNRNNAKFLDENFDFFHSDIEKFLHAAKYECLKKEYQKNNILSNIVNDLKDKPKKDFKKIILNENFFSFDEEGHLITKDTIFNHIIYEIELEGKNYFLINGKFYFIENNFVDRLNKTCKNFIKNNYNNLLDLPWKDGEEKDYNKSYCGKEKTIVLDRITPEGIELCDILKYDENNVYLFHVKKGFDGAMRDLSSQIFTSAKRLLEDIKSNKSYLKKIYETMEIKYKDNNKSKNNCTEHYKGQINSIEEFLNLFDKKIIYVLAIKDKSDRSIKENIENFKSNIAKFELSELIKKMKSIDMSFEITQIKGN